MFYFILVIHCSLCVALIGLVLIQQGKGADMGATFGGGGSNTLFGAGGATDLLTKATTALAISFMVTSIFLVRSYNQGGAPRTVVTSDPLAGSVMQGATQEVAEPEAAAPAAEEATGQEASAGEAAANTAEQASDEPAASNTEAAAEPANSEAAPEQEAAETTETAKQ